MIPVNLEWKYQRDLSASEGFKSSVNDYLHTAVDYQHQLSELVDVKGI